MSRNSHISAVMTRALHKLYWSLCFLLAGLTAGAQCNASISVSKNTTGNVSFSATVSGSVSSSTFTWNYGDGTGGSGLLTNHTYSNNGTYPISFTIISPPSCTNVAVDTVYITNADSCLLAASFIFNVGSNGLVSYLSTSTGTNPGTIYTWNFGNSNTVTAGPAVNHTYSANGLYTATLKISNGDSCSAIYSTAVNVDSVGCNLSANFTHLTGPGGVVSFFDASQGIPTGATYLWNFGDGVINGSVNPIHSYANAGTHYVSLLVKKGACADSIKKAINITGINCFANSGFNLVLPLPDSNWTAQPIYPWNVIAARWDWGDGSSSNTLYSSHNYATANFYTICLTVTVSCDSVSSTCVASEHKLSKIKVKPPGLSTGIQHPAIINSAMVIYPNPGNGLFTLEINGEALKNAQLAVYSLAGDLLLLRYGDLNSHSPEQIDLAHVPPGIYFLRISAGDYTCTRKLVISR
jgi:PKD repeat protein